jgi:hypothetical protein
MTLAADVIKRLKWRRDICQINNYHNDTPHNVMLSVNFFAVILSMVVLSSIMVRVKQERDCFSISNKWDSAVQSGTITKISRLNTGFENFV